MNVPEGKPKRLRPWLEALLNRGDIPGLQWIDKERTMFRISWKHHEKQDWSPEHGRIFMVYVLQYGYFCRFICLSSHSTDLIPPKQIRDG